jgi:hypothetical protein
MTFDMQRELEVSPPFSERGPFDPVFLTNGARHLSASVYVEPITTAVVAMWLAEGAVAYVGGQLLGKLLGDPSLRDISKLIKRAVEEIKQFVRAELRRQIEENEITRMEAALDAAFRNLRQYSIASQGNPQEGVFLLENAILSAGELMSLSRRFGINASTIYSNAVSLRAMSFVAYSKIKSLPQYEQNALDTLEEGIAHISTVSAELYESWEPSKRIGGPHIASSNQQRKRWVVFTLDGRQVVGREVSFTGDIGAEIEALRAEVFAIGEAERATVDGTVIDPLRVVALSWRKTMKGIGIQQH